MDRFSTQSQPPETMYNDQAEVALLGLLLTKPEMIEKLPGTFSPDHYGVPFHSDVHRALVEVGRPGTPALIQVCQALNLTADQRAYVVTFVTSVVAFRADYVASYAGIITEMYRRRGLLALASTVTTSMVNATADASADATIASAMVALEGLTTQQASARPHVMIEHAADAALAAADRAASNDGPSGLSTGFRSLDDVLGGMDPGSVTVLGGRPGMGKSALGHQIALAVAGMGIGVLEVSLEMSAQALGARTLSALSGVPLSHLRQGKHGYAASRLLDARRKLDGLPLSIEDGSGLTAGMIMLKARAAQRRHGLDLIMVDHIHIVRPDDGDVKQGATWAVGRISGAMKRMAKELNCAVLLLAQLSRGLEGREDKRPCLSDLRQAGDIEQDADAVGFVYRPEYYLSGTPEMQPSESMEKFANRISRWEADKLRLRGQAEVIFAKVREAEPGTVPLLFNGATTSFSECEPEMEY